MSIELTGQKKQVYEWFKANPKTTIREAHAGIRPGVDKVSARLSEIERLGVPVVRHGRNDYNEMMYSIADTGPQMKKITKIVTGADGRPYAEERLVPVDN